MAVVTEGPVGYGYVMALTMLAAVVVLLLALLALLTWLASRRGGRRLWDTGAKGFHGSDGSYVPGSRDGSANPGVHPSGETPGHASAGGYTGSNS